MKVENQLKIYVDELISQYPELHKVEEEICSIYLLMKNSFKNGGKLYICGNGGSASDAEHIVGELLKSFKIERPISGALRKKLVDNNAPVDLLNGLQEGLGAISLTNCFPYHSAMGNDVGFDIAYAQALYVLGESNDILLCLSTSGNSKNVINAAIIAQVKSIPVISLTGNEGGKLAQRSDVCLKVPYSDTARIQELHTPIYHCLCAMLEKSFFG